MKQLLKNIAAPFGFGKWVEIDRCKTRDPRYHYLDRDILVTVEEHSLTKKRRGIQYEDVMYGPLFSSKRHIIQYESAKMFIERYRK